MPKAFQISVADESIKHHYFVENGIGSIVVSSPTGLKAEAGLVGRDGVMPTAAIVGQDTATHDVDMQVGGNGHRIQSDIFAQI